ncbi:MAG: hypothetical protein L6Q80_11205 [Dehalococcoidia bacterium]|nr:hypothetical protein [Dehalococcoidia bacterium]
MSQFVHFGTIGVRGQRLGAFLVPVVVVTSNQPGEGKTGVAAAIARHYAYLGRTVKLARIDGDGRAGDDARFFGSLAFAPGSASAPVAASSVADPGADALLVVEAGPGEAASIANARVVLVAKGRAPASAPAGLTPSAVVVTRAGASAPANPADAHTVTLAEDRTLAGFSVAEVQALTGAETLIEGDCPDGTCDHLVISPISADAGQPHLKRFPMKAVVVRSDRTDQHLAALRGDTPCLLLTGGQRPSSNALDAAGASGVAVLLSPADTVQTVAALEALHENSRFQGERKLDCMARLLEGTALYAALDA